MRTSFFAIFELVVICGILYCVYLLLKKNIDETKKNKQD